MKLTLTNHKDDTFPRKVMIDLISRTCVVDDLSIIPLEGLSSLDFNHPLLEEPILDSAELTHTYTYDNFQALTRAGRFVYSVLLRSSHPTQCVFSIQPTSRYRALKSNYTPAFSLNAKKRAKSVLSLKAFNDITSSFREVKFQYQDSIVVETTLSFDNLPSELHADTLYDENLETIAFCEQADRLNDYEIRYIHSHIGLGVFSRRNIQPGEKIGLYCCLKTRNNPDHLNYTYVSVNDCLKLDLDARQYGNFTCFINHADNAPEEDELEPVLSYANVNAKGHRINGNFFVIFTAKSEIKAGEQLFVDYGKQYFIALEDKFFTYRNGRIVDFYGQKICRDRLKSKREFLIQMAKNEVHSAKFSLFLRPLIALSLTLSTATLLAKWFT